MFPVQTTTHVIKLSPWHIKLWIRGKQVSTNKNLTPPLSVSLAPFLSLSTVPRTSWEQAKLHLNYCIFPVSLSVCLSLPGMHVVGGVWMISGQLSWIQSARKAGSIQENLFFIYFFIYFTEQRMFWRSIGSSNAVMCWVCVWESGYEWQAEKRGRRCCGDAAEQRMTDVQMCLWCVFAGK